LEAPPAPTGEEREKTAREEDGLPADAKVLGTAPGQRCELCGAGRDVFLIRRRKGGEAAPLHKECVAKARGSTDHAEATRQIGRSEGREIMTFDVLANLYGELDPWAVAPFIEYHGASPCPRQVMGFVILRSLIFAKHTPDFDFASFRPPLLTIGLVLAAFAASRFRR
jgi:hypothetical protein